MKVFEVSKFFGGIYSSWIPNAQVVQSMDNCDLVIFKGGEDVNPSLYGEKRHATTHYNRMRDDYEKQIYEAARKMGKKILGVCRGAQFISVMNGAKLFQDIHGHGRPHSCSVVRVGAVQSSENFSVENDMLELPMITSTHHQCLDPYSVRTDMYFHGWSYGTLDNQLRLERGFLDDSIVVPEFYQFGNHSLCIQSHPEMVAFNGKVTEGYEPYINYCIELLNQFMNAK